MTTFLPNGFVTHEPCPVCQEPGIKVEHGHNEHGSRMHYEHCPNCGKSMPIVCYDCHWCDLNPLDISQARVTFDDLVKCGEALGVNRTELAEAIKRIGEV